MDKLVKSKKTIILAAFVSVMSFSLVSTAQVGALSFSDFFGSNRQNQGQSQNRNQNQDRNNNQNPAAPTTSRQTPTQQQTPTTQQPAQTTVTPTVPATPVVETQAPVQQTTVAPRTINNNPQSEAPVAVTSPDTSAAVIQTASSQSVGESKTDGTPYVSNKIDPNLAETLLFAGIGAMTLGTLIYASTLIFFNKPAVRHIPVKSL
jgi:cytoskeletal protein RodZ